MKRMMTAVALLVLWFAAVPAAADETSDTSAAELKPVAVSGGVASLGPTNTRITYIGLHEGDDPRPRLGGFEKFTGRAEVDASGNLRGITLDIDTGSLWTEIPRLTAHLKSPDFFDVREHPKATFRSTEVTAGEGPGEYQVRGELTLLGKTRTIQLPVQAQVSAEGLTLASDFAFDRREFGMTYGQGQVKNEVTVRVRVGEPTRGPGDASGERGR